MLINAFEVLSVKGRESLNVKFDNLMLPPFLKNPCNLSCPLGSNVVTIAFPMGAGTVVGGEYKIWDGKWLSTRYEDVYASVNADGGINPRRTYPFEFVRHSILADRLPALDRISRVTLSDDSDFKYSDDLDYVLLENKGVLVVANRYGFDVTDVMGENPLKVWSKGSDSKIIPPDGCNIIMAVSTKGSAKSYNCEVTIVTDPVVHWTSFMLHTFFKTASIIYGVEELKPYIEQGWNEENAGTLIYRSGDLDLVVFLNKDYNLGQAHKLLDTLEIYT